MVAQDEDAVRLDCRGEMAVADVPGELGEMHRVARADVVEFFLGRDDLDMPAVFEHQPVAMAEHDGLGKVDEHLAAVDEFDGAAAQMAFVMGQHGRRRGVFDGVRIMRPRRPKPRGGIL